MFLLLLSDLPGRSLMVYVQAVVAAAAGCKGADAAIAVATSTEDNFNTDAEKKAMLIKILEKRRKVLREVCVKCRLKKQATTTTWSWGVCCSRLASARHCSGRDDFSFLFS